MKPQFDLMYKSNNYVYKLVSKSLCLIETHSGKILGSVIIDEDRVWTPHYTDGIKYLPINSAIKLLIALGEIEGEME